MNVTFQNIKTSMICKITNFTEFFSTEKKLVKFVKF